MLILERVVGQSIRIGEDINVLLQKSWSGRARIGIAAPPEIPILRAEINRHHSTAAHSPLSGTHVSAAKVVDLAMWLGSRAATAKSIESRESYQYARDQLLALVGEVPA